MMGKHFFFGTILLFFALTCQAQYFSAGQDPASVNWSQINTDHFQLIFPESFGEKAQYVANILEYSYEKVGYSMEHEPRKVSVILHNQTIESNGFVSPTPYKMELFSVPPQDNSTVSWLEHLSIHELRHVVQIDKLNQGITKILTYLFGQQATGGVAGLVPMWFYEGDAVLAETALTPDGRGRQSSFSKEIKSLTLDSSFQFSANKMLLGSYKHNTPNHYSLGYHLVSYLRQKEGVHIWSDIEDYTARNPYQIASFNLGTKKYANLSFSNLFNESIDFYDSLWTARRNERRASMRKRINVPGNKAYTSYRYPQFLKDSGVVALKKDYSYLPHFVSIYDGEEEVLHIPGMMTSEKFSYANGKLAWSEKVNDLRWAHRSYSVIKLFHLETGEEEKITRKSRFFAPDLSSNGGQIVCVKISQKNEASLVILGSKNGIIQQEFFPPEGQFLQKPEWSVQDKYIFVIGLTERGKALYRVNVQSGKWTEIMKPGYEDIQNISPGKQSVFLHADRGVTDNIYQYHYKDQTFKQLTWSQNGATDVCYSSAKEKFLYVDYAAKGYDIYESDTSAGNSNRQHIQKVEPEKSSVIAHLEEQEPPPVFTEDIPENEFEVTNYSRLKNLFKFHSWAPFYFDYQEVKNELVEPKVGLMLLSQNELSTATTSIGYSYYKNRHQFHTRFVYQGWYPVISFSSNYGSFSEVIQPSSQTSTPDPGADFIDFSMNVALPLTLDADRFLTRLTPSVTYEYGSELFYNLREDYYMRGLKTIEYNLQFYSIQRQAYRDLLPKWGVLMNLNVLSSPFSEDILGNRFSFLGNLFLPGLVEDHSIKLTGGYQKQEPELYIFSNYLEIPRGYQALYSEELINGKLDYALPLFYPDWNLSSLLYIKRFKGDLFVDFAYNKYQAYNQTREEMQWHDEHLYSYGAELTADFHFARIMFPLSAGIRYSYRPKVNQASYEFIFNINLYSIYNKTSDQWNR